MAMKMQNSSSEPETTAADSTDALTVPDVQETAALGGRVHLLQPKVGYRAGLDAALLAASLGLAAGERALEAGCGVGAALLQAAVRYPETQLIGVERAPDALALAQQNILANQLSPRVQVRSLDIRNPFSSLGLAPFDSAFANPPYFDDEAALRAPHPARREAWIAEGGLAVWTHFLLKAVKEGGRITLIHRADRLADILSLLSTKAGSFRIRPIQPFADAPAKRVLVRAVKTGKAPLVLLPALVLRTRNPDCDTAEAKALARGETALGWD